MIPGPTIYYKCPICELLTSTGSLVSGNTFGSRLFSDGKSISPMLPEFPVMNKCQDCNHSYWLNDSTKFNGDISEKRITQAIFPNIEDLHNLLESKFYESKDEESYLRLRLLWAFNDRLRDHKQMFNASHEEEIWRNNQERHLEILDESRIDDKFLKAEILRNRGEFYDSFLVLMSVNGDEYGYIVDAFAKEINNENKEVFEIIS